MIRLCLVSFFLSVSCAFGCADKDSGSLLFSEQDERELGAGFHEELLAEMPEYTGDPVVTQYVRSMGEAVVPHSTRPDLAHTFTVLDSDELNAFAILGGYVYVTTALLREADSAASVAAVLAHEVAHVSARHGVQAVETYIFAAGLGELLGGGDFGEVVAGAIQVGAGLTFSQDQELEADELGVNFARAAGFNPWGLVAFFEYLQELERPDGTGEREAGEGDGDEDVFDDLGELFSTHPPTDERINRTREQLDGLGVTEQTDGLLWETDPVHGDIVAILTPAEE